MNTLIRTLAMGLVLAALCLGCSDKPGPTPRTESNKRHVVTASRTEWLYKTRRSGVGEANPVVIRAAVGDTIEFKQSDGEHGVFLYVTAPNESELGKRITVNQNFEVLKDTLKPKVKLEPLSNRLFSRKGLTTQSYRGNSSILTIRILENFIRTIYFGCRVHSVFGGRHEFGVIVPSAPKAPPPKAPLVRAGLPTGFSMDSVKNLSAPYLLGQQDNLELGHLSNDPAFEFMMRRDPQRGYRMLRSREREEESTDHVEQWFRDMPNLYSSDCRWYYTITADVDEDGDLDVIAAVGSVQDSTCQWWVLESNVAKDGLPEDDLRFTRAAEILKEKVPLEWAKHAFCVVADMNRDYRPDMVLYDGNPNGQLQVYHNTGPISRERQYSFEQSDRPIATSRYFQQQSPRLVYPYDFDFDGWTDLLVYALGKEAVIYFNTTTGEFSDTVSLPGSSYEMKRVGVKDIDGDEIPDLIIEDKENSLHVYYNNGDRSFYNPENRINEYTRRRF